MTWHLKELLLKLCPAWSYKYSDTSILFYGYAVLKFDPQFCLKHLQLTQF